VESLAWSIVAKGQPARAARLGGAAEALREALGVSLQAEQHLGHERAVQAMRAALGDGAFDAAWSEGRTLSLDDATSLALAGTPASA
jgi:hypothetical protein